MREALYGNARFRVTRQLGGGAVGMVYEATDRERNVQVALKVLSSMSAETLTRFKREFRALQELRHPNLIELGELFEEAGQWFYSMELVDGVDFLAHCGVQVATLPSSVRITGARARAGALREPAAPREVPARAMPCDEDRLREVLSQLAAALGELHEAGFVHRDVKPSNVLVADGPRVVLLDLGLVADAINPRRSLDLDTIVGTPLYMAPEQALGRSCTAAADWYSLGVMLYEALTGIAPFEGTALEMILRKQQTEPPPPSAIATGVPRDLDRLCAALLATTPEDRPSEPEILRALRAPGHERGSIPRTRPQTSADDTAFVGREHELGALADAFTTARARGPVTVRLRGDSGVGKSALVRTFLRTIAGTADVLVLEGRCYERESVPFKAFDGIVDSLARHLRAQPAGALSRLLPRNADLLAQTFPILQGLPEMLPRLLSRTQDQQQQRGLVFGAIRELLQNLASGAALVLVIDDVQWADADSAVLLRHLLQPPDAPPLLLIVIDRAGTDEVFELPPTEVREIALTGLPSAAAAALAQRLLSPSGHGDLALAEEIARETGGHPLYIDELVGHVASHGAANVRRGLRMRDVIWSRVRVIPATQFAALRVLCVAESPLPPEVVRIAAGTGERAFERDVAALRASNLVRASRDRLEPYHDQVRHTVNANLDADSMIDANRRLAMALEASGESRQRPELLVQPYLATGLHARAAHYAAEAGRRAAAAFAFDRANELFAQALELG
ncbi:MAG: protein kinase, partial [Deltaproteobacteria bacterium]|nr:protein kinase [Deltaproteobacteria bacterium]